MYKIGMVVYQLVEGKVTAFRIREIYHYENLAPTLSIVPEANEKAPAQLVAASEVSLSINVLLQTFVKNYQQRTSISR